MGRDVKPPAATTVPAALDALTTVFEAIPGEITVVDGYWPTQPEATIIAVGIGGADDESVGVEQEPAGMGSARIETLSIVCGLSKWHGDNEMKPLRDECGDLLDQIRAKIAEDPTLGSAVDEARLGPDMSWQQYLTDVGAVVSVGFTVSARTHV